MDKSLDLYKIFHAVAKAGSFSDAARELYITQPAVSQSVRNLETEIGVQLFVRGAKGVELTREGKILSDYVSSAMGMLEAGESRMRMLAMLDAGELRIGASDTVSKWFLLPIIQKFHRTYPNISLTITNRTTAETIRLLKSGSIDIGYVNLPAESDGVVFEECMPVHDTFIAGNAYSELKGREVSLSELAEYPLIMLESAARSRQWVDHHFQSNGVPLLADVELSAHDLLVDFARIELGIACVIREFVLDSINDGTLFEIQLQPHLYLLALLECAGTAVLSHPQRLKG